MLGHLDALVVKPANESGGYGVVIGPTAGAEALALVAQRIEQFPPNWVAQPVLSLSTMPTLCDGDVVPRHVDLRPFALLGPDRGLRDLGRPDPGGPDEGSLIVNSSQGGGSKDTWIVDATLATRRHGGSRRAERSSRDSARRPARLAAYPPNGHGRVDGGSWPNS